jgi:two-component system KDP operon response regulator KdpE
VTRVLVVDDDPAIQRTLAIGLRANGYDVLPARDGRTAVQACAEDAPDVVLLDLGLPDLSGTEVLRLVRESSQVPVIVLSARQGSQDKVDALDHGADDYVTKPFGMDELLARLRAACRRSATEQPAAPVVTDAFTVDLEATVVRRDGQEVRLTPTEWRLLSALVTRPGRLVSQRQLLAEAWGPGYVAETNYVRVYVAGLRRKLEPDPTRPRYLVTELGMGYRFVP